MPRTSRTGTTGPLTAQPTGLANGDPVLVTRLRPPRPPGTFLRRDRLVRRLDAAVRSPVTLVNGPAGAGKTLLVADWLAHGRRPGPTGWLTLEAEDNLPGNFWAYVRETLRDAVGELPAELGAPARAEHVEPSLLIRLAAWLNRQPEPVLLVLDEFEHIEDPALPGQLHELVRHTAGHLRLVLISRTEPLLPLHRYRAAGELAEIRAADLALTRAEAAAVLERHGLHPSPATVDEVHRRLSGWTAGLRLLALAARRSGDAGAYLKRIDAERAAVADFLLAEVLHAQSRPTQDLLLRCSILGRIHPDLADELTGRRDGRRILSGLHRSGVFTEALPDDWYRLHPMFSGILHLHLRDTAPDRIDGLHLRAARWLAAHGQDRAALEHAVAGGSWATAAQLLVDQLAVGALFTGRDAARLRTMFEGMPATVRAPAAELVRAALHLARSEVGAALRVLDRVEPHLPQEVPTQLAAAFLRADAGRLLGSAPLADSAARLAHELEGRAPAGPLARHPELLPLVDADRGSALLWQGSLDEAGRALDAAARVAPSPATAGLRHDALCRLALIDYLRGWPGRAEQRVRRADEEADRSSLPQDGRTGVRDLVLAATALEREELAAADAALDRLADGGPPARDPVVALGRTVVRARLHLALRQPPAALEVLERSRREDLAGRSSAWGRERLAVTASAVHLAVGRPRNAVAALRDVTTAAPDSVVAAARARLAAGQDEERTVEQLRALRDDATVGSATRTRALLLLAQAAPEHDAQTRVRLLTQALATARPERIRLPFRESAGWVRRELRRHPELGRAHPWLPADLRPAAPSAPPVGPSGEGPSPLPTEPVTPRERDVLACAGRMLSTQEIADELFLSPNTVKTHLKSVNRKLATANRRDAVRTARRLHLIDEHGPGPAEPPPVHRDAGITPAAGASPSPPARVPGSG